MIQSAVANPFEVAQLRSDLTQAQLDEAVGLVDELRPPLSEKDIEALIKLLPGGDAACDLNWTILHAIEHSPHWPVWRLLADPDHEWLNIFRIRLRNAGGVHS